MNIRQSIRQKRRELSLAQRNNAQTIIYQKIKNHPAVNQAQHIAIFLSFDGEVDTKPIIEYLWQQNKSVYLPVPIAEQQLLFLNYSPKTPLIKNKFGILQPAIDETSSITIEQLDIVFTPLVAFDERGYRMGMGGGYYDRALANYQKQQILPIGLAFACQKVAKLDNQPLDIKLPEIIYA